VIGVVVRNARLTAQLRAQVDELQASRRRLLEVHDDVRRGLERDIHDGAQSRLVALRLRLGLARAHADCGDPAALAGELDRMGAEVDAAVRSLRELARGLHPPLLEQAGIVAALESHARTLPIAVSVEGRGVARYPRAVEGAVYFCCLEAIQNALAHGAAGRVDIDLEADTAALRFAVRDDGVGFDVSAVARGSGLTNMGDRVAALGGQLRIDARPGEGTCVSGSIPVQELVSDR
jgi:two-component system, NarL family, sensor kinase